MFIPKEEITIVLDASGSMVGDPKLMKVFQKIVWNVVMRFSRIPTKLYILGMDLKKINIDYYLNLDEKGLRNLSFDGGHCIVEKISKIQNTGHKLFLTDGAIGFVEKRILSNWILTCDASDSVCSTMDNMIPIMDKWGMLNVDSVKKILEEIDVRRKNQTVVCREYETVSVL